MMSKSSSVSIVPGDQVEHPPLRLDRHELGVVQDQPHRFGQRLVRRLAHRRDIGVGMGRDMRADDARDQVVGRAGLGRRAVPSPPISFWKSDSLTFAGTLLPRDDFFGGCTLTPNSSPQAFSRSRALSAVAADFSDRFSVASPSNSSTLS